MQPRRVLVTGASGFLGANLCGFLSNSGHLPIAAIRPNSNRQKLAVLAPDAEVVFIDLGCPDQFVDALEDSRPDVLVNCASYGVNNNEQDFQQAFTTNVTGAVGLAIAAEKRGVPLIHIGTAYEYGASPYPMNEQTPLAPKGIYGATKAAASLLLSQRMGGQAICILRVFSMYGPLEGSHKLIPLAMRASHMGTPLALSAGDQMRDYLYVDDVCCAITLAIEANPYPPREILNIASGAPVSLRQLLVTAAEAGDSKVFEWGALPYRKDEVMSVVGDATRAKRVLGWSATTPLAEGMEKLRRFHQTHRVEF